MTSQSPRYASVARRVERSHDPGDSVCIKHDPGAIYTMVVHLCPVCRPPQSDPGAIPATGGES